MHRMLLEQLPFLQVAAEGFDVCEGFGIDPVGFAGEDVFGDVICIKTFLRRALSCVEGGGVDLGMRF